MRCCASHAPPMPSRRRNIALPRLIRSDGTEVPKMDERKDLEDTGKRGANVDPDNTYSTQNAGAAMRPPRAEERRPKRGNKPETAETRATDADNRIEREEDMSHRLGGRDDKRSDPAIRNEKQLVADSKSQAPDEAHGDTFEETSDASDKERHA